MISLASAGKTFYTLMRIVSCTRFFLCVYKEFLNNFLNLFIKMKITKATGWIFRAGMKIYSETNIDQVCGQHLRGKKIQTFSAFYQLFQKPVIVFFFLNYLLYLISTLNWINIHLVFLNRKGMYRESQLFSNLCFQVNFHYSLTHCSK